MKNPKPTIHVITYYSGLINKFILIRTSKKLFGKLCFTFLLCLLAHFSGAQGCNLSSGGAPSDNYQLFNNLGNPQLDNYVATDVNALRSFFNVQPSFFYFADDNSPNAFATPNIQVQQYQSGTVCLGRALFLQEWAKASNLTTIPVIIAHEFGHIVDFNYGAIPSDAETMQKELFADFMAGVFLRYRSSLTITDIRGVLNSFFSHGDYEFTNPTHHGTPIQRVAAVEAGYNWYAGQGDNTSVTDMIAAGKSYLGYDSNDVNTNSSGGQTGSYSSGNNQDNDNSSNLANNVSATTTFGNRTDNGVTTYSYTVKVRNNNNVSVKVTVGGFKYGYYQNCNAGADNFVEQGDFGEKTVTVDANDVRYVRLSVDLTENPPTSCSGVPGPQQAQIIEVDEDN